MTKFEFRPRDIVKFEGDGPCEVITAFRRPQGQMLFIINKKTLSGDWTLSREVEFVRRPGTQQ